MGFLIKKVIVQRDINDGYELFEYPLEKIVDFPYIAGEITSLIPKDSMFSEDARRTEFNTPMFNKNNLGKFIVNIGEKGIFYLNLRPGYKLNQIYVEPEDLVTDIFYSNDNSLLYCFYNPTAKETIVVTACSEIDTENLSEKVRKDPLNINLRQEFIKKALKVKSQVQKSGNYVFRKTGKRFKNKGDIFEVKFNGENIILPQMYLDGFYYIHEILRNGTLDNGIETSKLYNLVKGFPGSKKADIGGINYNNDEDSEAELSLQIGITDKLIDQTTKNETTSRLKKLRSEREDAETYDNKEAIIKIDQEISDITEYLNKSLDKNGRPRKIKTPDDRIVHNIQIRVGMIEKMAFAAKYTEFARFIGNNIKVSKSSRYISSPDMDWELD